VRKRLFQWPVVLLCVPIFIISTVEPFSTLNAQTPIDLQTPQQENEKDEKEDLRLFLRCFPQTLALFEHLTDWSSSLSLDESCRQGIRPMLSATDGRLLISERKEAGQTLADIAAAYGCKALYEDILAQRRRGGMSLAGMLNSPVQSMQPLPSASTPVAAPAPLPV
jgi:hypothetical protein